MSPHTLHKLTNWAPVLHSEVTRLVHKNQPSPNRESLYITSGSEPYGAVTELHHGHEARVTLAMAGIQEIGNGIWIIDNAVHEGRLIFMSTPELTTIYHFHDDPLEILGVTGGVQDGTTLTVGITNDGAIIQVTNKAILALQADEDYYLREIARDTDMSGKLVAAIVDSKTGFVLLAILDLGEYYLTLKTFQPKEKTCSFGTEFSPVPIASRPSAIAIYHHDSRNYAVVGTMDGFIFIYHISDGGIQEIAAHRADDSSLLGNSAVIESVTALSPGLDSSDVIILCGLRSGVLFTVEFTVNYKDSKCSLGKKACLFSI
jgi:hypothetical protein